MRKFFKNDAVQTVLSSLICVVLGLFIGFIVLCFIDRSGAWTAITAVVKNFLTFSRPDTRMKYLGNTLAKSAPLLMCSLSILFSYKVGLFNIGCAGQYCAGIAVSLYAALAWKLPWWLCVLMAMAAGALLGTISGLLKSYCNVNEVISGIMLNWITLYLTNMLLTGVKESTSPYTINIVQRSRGSLLPSLGLGKLFNDNEYVTIAVPLAILIAVAVMILLDKTLFGYELKATGANKDAAKYCGMAEKRNIIVTLAIGGALAALGASFLYLTGFEQWNCSNSSVPGMGFNGIASAFLGGLNPIGAVLSSFFIQHITAGGAYVDKKIYCSQISDLISAIIIYLCGFVLFMKVSMNKLAAKAEARRAGRIGKAAPKETEDAIKQELERTQAEKGGKKA